MPAEAFNKFFHYFQIADISFHPYSYDSPKLKYSVAQDEDYVLLLEQYNIPKLNLDIMNNFFALFSTDLLLPIFCMWILFWLLLIANQIRIHDALKYLYKLCLLKKQNVITTQKFSQHKLLHVLWMLILITVISYIPAVLSTKLIIEDHSKMINSLQDLLNLKKLPLWISGSKELWEFKKGKSDLYAEVYSNAVKHGLDKCINHKGILV